MGTILYSFSDFDVFLAEKYRPLRDWSLRERAAAFLILVAIERSRA